MDYHTIAHLHQSDPTFQALRKDWLPLAVGFLHQAFKVKHVVTLPQQHFLERLDAYIEQVNQGRNPDEAFRHNAAYYLDRWSREDDLIRVRSHQEDADYVVQLSPYAERLIGWFDDMQSHRMIGTESRLLNILALLDEVVTRSTEDVEKRLQQLMERRDEISAEIARIQETQQVDGLDALQIRERLDHISGQAGQLLRDFSLVEERFRDIARAIQQAQLDPDARRGDILGSALDADEALADSDEGRSFRAFYEVLTHPDQRESLDGLIEAVYAAPNLREHVEENSTLRRLTSHLLDAGERVNDSTRRLAEHLRRVVDRQSVLESRRVQSLAQEIKHAVSQLDAAAMPPLMRSRAVFHTLEGEPEVDLPMERPLYAPPEVVEPSQRPQPASSLIDPDALLALYDLFYIDDALLRDKIARELMSRDSVTLAVLLNSHPVKQGIAEVIAYLHIAAHDPRHHIDRGASDLIMIRTRDGAAKQIVMPRITFRRAALTTTGANDE